MLRVYPWAHNESPYRENTIAGYRLIGKFYYSKCQG